MYILTDYMQHNNTDFVYSTAFASKILQVTVGQGEPHLVAGRGGIARTVLGVGTRADAPLLKHAGVVLHGSHVY